MPRRFLFFATDNFYHIFNRSNYRRPILTKKKDLEIFLSIMTYYLQVSPPIKFSYYRINPNKYTLDNTRLVTILSYCLMPTHFHLTLRQEKERGIQIYMQRVLNSFSHYYRRKNQESGPLFESSFKGVHIETDEQLIHLSRYHHLNPVTSYMVDDPKDYIYSSYNDYLKGKSQIVDPSYVLSNFSSSKQYAKFVLDQKEYQRELERIKHLIFA